MTTIEAAIEYVEMVFQNNSGGHDAEHTKRVYHNAMQIAEHEQGADVLHPELPTRGYRI